MPKQPEWFEAGLNHTWLPYTQMQIAPLPQAVTSTEGCRIKLADGTELIDGIASWWSMCHGYNHPHIVGSVEKQLRHMPHVMFGGLVHEGALKLASRLCKLTDMDRVFYGDSGSIAVEIALKMALQFWRNSGKPHKDRFICFSDGYHGDTLGAMSVSDPERSMHKAFKNSVIKQYVIDIPSDEYGFAEFDSLLSGIAGNVAAIIIEPLVQGAGGMRFHSADTLAELHRIAKKHDVLFIADEVATGFLRTGNMFACDEAGIKPDILCLGKALTAGTMTMGVALASEAIFEAFLSDDMDSAFMHGPTFMANPLACAAANASLDLFEQEPRAAQVEAIEVQLREELSACEDKAGVVDVRVKGAIGVVQIEQERMDYYGLREQFIKRGCWIRPFGDIIYLAPSLTISGEELSTLTQSIAEVLG